MEETIFNIEKARLFAKKNTNKIVKEECLTVSSCIKAINLNLKRQYGSTWTNKIICGFVFKNDDPDLRREVVKTLEDAGYKIISGKRKSGIQQMIMFQY